MSGSTQVWRLRLNRHDDSHTCSSSPIWKTDLRVLRCTQKHTVWGFSDTCVQLPPLLEARMWQQVCGKHVRTQTYTAQFGNMSEWHTLPLFCLPCSTFDLKWKVYEGGKTRLLKMYALFKQTTSLGQLFEIQTNQPRSFPHNWLGKSA